MINEKYMANNYFIVESSIAAGHRPQAVAHKLGSGVAYNDFKGNKVKEISFRSRSLIIE